MGTGKETAALMVDVVS
jgi:hypothetical protein